MQIKLQWGITSYQSEWPISESLQIINPGKIAEKKASSRTVGGTVGRCSDWGELYVQSLGHVWLFATPWTVAHQAPRSMGFSWQEHWSGLPLPSPGNLPGPGIKRPPRALAGRFFMAEPPRKPMENST